LKAVLRKTKYAKVQRNKVKQDSFHILIFENWEKNKFLPVWLIQTIYILEAYCGFHHNSSY